MSKISVIKLSRRKKNDAETLQMMKRKIYNHCVHKSKLKFLCKKCSIKILPRDYRRHLIKIHKLHTDSVCMWCLSFKLSEHERLTADHRIECFKGIQIVKNNEVVSLP